MAIDLSKGGFIDLTKDTGANEVVVGLSWGKNAQVATKKDPVQKERKGLLARAFDRLVGSGEEIVHVAHYTGSPVDVDSCVALVDKRGNLVDKIFFAKRQSKCGSIYHHGDDRTGSSQYGKRDNEEIDVLLKKIPANVERAVFIAHIFNGGSKGQHFGQIRGSYIRVSDPNNNYEELVRYNLADEYDGMRGIVVGEFERSGSADWLFRAIGQGVKTDNLDSIIQMVL